MDFIPIREDDDESTLSRNWRELGVDIERVEDNGGTLTPCGFGTTLDERRTVPEVVELPTIIENGVTLERVLGRGTSGVVWLGEQKALTRAVAIKRPHEGSDKDPSWLMREARVNGALEHPNIVPVHDIVVEDGAPMIVMKRVVGRGWDEEMREDRKLLDEDGFLERHLRVLIQVARAAHFAHDHGVLHRDIKPENVMLGDYAEVYLVDWSIAAALEDCVVSRMPLAREVRQLFGTPAYMAPEMAACSGPEHGPCTDVYLLGACLFEIITGKAPHRSPDVMASITRAFLSKPPVFVGEVAPKLRDLCTHALARDPKARIASAGEFANALESFLTHRHSLRLHAEGREKLRALEYALDAGEREESTALFRECRFLLVQALSIWPRNLDARVDLRRTTERLVRYELDHKNPEAARAILRGTSKLEGEYPLLVEEAERACEARAKDSARLEGIARDRDIAIGSRSRGKGAAILSILSVVVNLTCGALNRWVLEIAHLEYALALSIYFVLGLGVVFLLRKEVFATTANRQLSFTSVFTIGAYVLVQLLAYAADVAFPAALAFQCLVFTLLWVVGTAAFDRRMIALPIVGAIEIPLVLLFPAWGFEILAVAVGTGLVATSLLLRARPERERVKVTS